MKTIYITILSVSIPTIAFVAVNGAISTQNGEMQNIAVIQKELEMEWDKINLDLKTDNSLDANSCSSDCMDCKFFPVNKANSLRADYIPTVVGSDLPGGREIVSEIKEPLTGLFKKAKEFSLNLQIVSGYRSYAIQESLFDSYVQSELAKAPGISFEEASKRANIYSAKPGHSEHQLGTTVDITCVGCAPFQFDQKNQKAYDFLNEWANDFGFIISYPDGTTDLTGYKYEPWHLRFVGEDFAERYKTENQEKETKMPLEKFLGGICSDD